MRFKKIGKIDRIAPDLRVEIESASHKTTRTQDRKHCQRCVKNVVWELIGIPTVAWITPICID
jgi:hypothetical protein